MVRKHSLVIHRMPDQRNERPGFSILGFHKQKIGRFDILRRSSYCKNAIISPKREVRIVINPDEVKLNIKGDPVKNPDTVYKLTAVVTTTTKKKYKSSYKYCYNDLLGLTYVEESTET